MKTNSIPQELLETLGKTGTITILKELERENRRFSALKKLLTHATLAKRLRELEKMGLIERKIVDSRPPSSQYILTSRGREVLQLLRKLGTP
jgi:DNA-binding HxlR family transcriptional regulator